VGLSEVRAAVSQCSRPPPPPPAPAPPPPPPPSTNAAWSRAINSGQRCFPLNIFVSIQIVCISNITIVVKFLLLRYCPAKSILLRVSVGVFSNTTRPLCSNKDSSTDFRFTLKYEYRQLRVSGESGYPARPTQKICPPLFTLISKNCIIESSVTKRHLHFVVNILALSEVIGSQFPIVQSGTEPEYRAPKVGGTGR
jgi:hypothetical protein